MAMAMANSTALQKRALRKQMQSVLRELPKDALASQGAAVLRHLERFGPFVGAHRVGCYVAMSAAELPTSSIIDSLVQAKKKVFLPFVGPCDPPAGGDPPNSVPGATRKPSTRMDLLEFHPPSGYTSFAPADHLVPFKFSASSPEIFQFHPALAPGLANGTSSPPPSSERGVGFDEYGNRLGHGKGYYDRFIGELMKKEPVHATREDGADAEEGGKKQEGAPSRPRASPGPGRPVLVGVCLREQLLSAPASLPRHPHDQTLDFLVSPDGVFDFSRPPPH